MSSLITFANSLDSDQADKMPDLDQPASHSDAIPEIIFQKKNDFEKKNQQTTKRKHAKLPRGLGWGIELTYTYFTVFAKMICVK